MGNQNTLNMQTYRLWMVALACGYILAGGAVAATSQDDMRAMDIIPFSDDVEAPNFVLPTPDGKTLQLRDFKGKLVLLNFWATW